MKIVQFKNGKYAVRKGWLDHRFLLANRNDLYFTFVMLPSEDSEVTVNSVEEAEAAIKRYYERARALRDNGKPVKKTKTSSHDPWWKKRTDSTGIE